MFAGFPNKSTSIYLLFFFFFSSSSRLLHLVFFYSSSILLFLFFFSSSSILLFLFFFSSSSPLLLLFFFFSFSFLQLLWNCESWGRCWNLTLWSLFSPFWSCLSLTDPPMHFHQKILLKIQIFFNFSWNVNGLSLSVQAILLHASMHYYYLHIL